MSIKRYRLSRQAILDLESIADFLGEKNPKSAVDVLDKLESTFSLLGKNPGLGIARDDLHEGVRMFVPTKPARNYVIFFYQTASGIEISDVIHAARDWVGMFARGER